MGLSRPRENSRVDWHRRYNRWSSMWKCESKYRMVLVGFTDLRILDIRVESHPGGDYDRGNGRLGISTLVNLLGSGSCHRPSSWSFPTPSRETISRFMDWTDSTSFTIPIFVALWSSCHLGFPRLDPRLFLPRRGRCWFLLLDRRRSILTLSDSPDQ